MTSIQHGQKLTIPHQSAHKHKPTQSVANKMQRNRKQELKRRIKVSTLYSGHVHCYNRQRLTGEQMHSISYHSCQGQRRVKLQKIEKKEERRDEERQEVEFPQAWPKDQNRGATWTNRMKTGKEGERTKKKTMQRCDTTLKWFKNEKQQANIFHKLIISQLDKASMSHRHLWVSLLFLSLFWSHEVFH